eukprot:TRINITY_DN104915_c0_g1_i1.p1 TRINITY_DN104915_c0_g1~~TRINITY_DN104915_c0_g1_i1.p1  ORF type:complete len:196 (+),score=34.54 TRINITY_DN104915_c0_g1_i1:87-674(+)
MRHVDCSSPSLEKGQIEGASKHRGVRLRRSTMAAVVSTCEVSGPGPVMTQHDAILKFVTGTSLAMDLEEQWPSGADFPPRTSDDALLKYISKSSMAFEMQEHAPSEPAPRNNSWLADAGGLMKVILKELMIPSAGGPMCEYTFADSEVPPRQRHESDTEFQLALQLSMDEVTSKNNFAEAAGALCHPQVIGRAFD